MQCGSANHILTGNLLVIDHVYPLDPRIARLALQLKARWVYSLGKSNFIRQKSDQHNVFLYH